MTEKPATPPRAASPPIAAAEQVNYMGLTHFLRSKGFVARAAELLVAEPKRPSVANIGQAMVQFGAVTPNAAGVALVDYFLALVARALLERGRVADPLVIYSLQQALVKLATKP